MESAILTILSASIAAIISAGVFFTNAWLQRRHEFKFRLADKYEEMAWLVHEADAWLIEIETVTGADPSLKERYPKPAAKAQVIAGIYFKKDFYTIIKKLNDDLNGYREYLADFQALAEPDEAISLAAVQFQPEKCAELRQELQSLIVMIHQEIAEKAAPHSLL